MVDRGKSPFLDFVAGVWFVFTISLNPDQPVWE